ncbi:ABC transporter permease [Nonomuraea angiospora]|uniref:Peptide/nickel transport system permease protein n=1 Tax=Nonomuraea angiospora TaxID=46172 RepID=A0ABR9LTI9_9ACTN|nr:ABC transporter permease [Nonomuraea angiospora]MBE1583680.1 peptide/nickel transport system permease protein [Nonomuraea angiospora]
MADIPLEGGIPRARRLNPTLARYLSAFRTPKGVIGLSILAVMSLAALLAPVLFPGGYDEQGREALTGISAAHVFGVDEFGRDIFVRSIYGLRIDLSLIFTAVPLSMAIGVLLGLSGALSEHLGSAVQRLLDVIIGFPGLILGICLVAILGPGWPALFLTILISGLPTAGRLARGAWLAQQSREYVLAARVLGVSRPQLLVRHVLPNAMDSAVVNAAVWMVVGVYIEAGLSIVGLGVQPPTPSLGVLLNNGLRFVTQSPTYIVGPALLLLLVAVAFSLVSDALNEAVNRR